MNRLILDKSKSRIYNISATEYWLQGGESLGTIEKAKQRLKNEPFDYTFKEAENLLVSLGFEKYNKGKTSGSRVRFVKSEYKIDIHKPHPQKEMKRYAVRQLKEKLEEFGEL